MRAVLLTVCSLFVCLATSQAALITFEELPLGDYGDNFTFEGVTFATYPGAHLQITDQSADGFGNAYSLGQKLSVWGDQPLVPKEKTSFLISFARPVNKVSFWLTGLFQETTVNAYDLDNNLIDSYIQTYPMEEPVAPDGRPWDYYYDGVLRFVELKEHGIARLSIQPEAYDGFSMDDLRYNPSPVPEPATYMLLGLGVAGIVIFMRRKH